VPGVPCSSVPWPTKTDSPGWSDVDLAAWGIEGTAFYKAVAAVGDLTTEFKVDLVDPGDCRPSFGKVEGN